MSASSRIHNSKHRQCLASKGRCSALTSTLDVSPYVFTSALCITRRISGNRSFHLFDGCIHVRFSRFLSRGRDSVSNVENIWKGEEDACCCDKKVWGVGRGNQQRQWIIASPWASNGKREVRAGVMFLPSRLTRNTTQKRPELQEGA